MDKAEMSDIETSRMLIEIAMEIWAGGENDKDSGKLGDYLVSAASYINHAITGRHSCSVAESLVAGIFTHIAIEEARNGDAP